MKEIRWHARAGQGAKTAAQLLATALLSDGKSVQALSRVRPRATRRPDARVHPVRRPADPAP
jgi:pyruvate ferredoxin oxidoreductase gamma subunit